MDDKNGLKKQIERLQMATLMSTLKDSVEDVVDNEGPDFIITYKGRKIGLEVISCHSLQIETRNKLSIQEIYVCLHSILRRYKQHVMRRGETSKIVSVSFKDRVFDIKHIKRLENDIFNEIDICRFSNDGAERVACKYVEYANEYQVALDGVEMVLCDAFWATIPVKNSNILYCIEKKEKKLSEYVAKKVNLDGIWLVISFIDDRGTDIRSVSQLTLKTKYDRVYLTSYSDVVRLK